jgi:hypothetical protein
MGLFVYITGTHNIAEPSARVHSALARHSQSQHVMPCTGKATNKATQTGHTTQFIYLYHNITIFTDTHNVAKHSAQVHSALATLSVTARQAMHGGNQQTRQRKQGILHNMFISGHAQASPEATSARPSKHVYRGTIQQEVPPNQSHAEVPQSTSQKRGPRDTARARSFIP